MRELKLPTIDALSLREALEALEKELDIEVEMVYIGNSFNDERSYISSQWETERAHFVLPGEAWIELESGEFVHIKEA